LYLFKVSQEKCSQCHPSKKEADSCLGASASSERKTERRGGRKPMPEDKAEKGARLQVGHNSEANQGVTRGREGISDARTRMRKKEARGKSTRKGGFRKKRAGVEGHNS